MRGLQNTEKRRAIFKFCRDRAEIVFLQETHSQPNIERCWEAEWGGKIIFSHGESNARGVAILYVKGVEIGKNVICDQNGRWIICTLKQCLEEFTLCNVYGPNKDSPEFYQEISKNLQEGSHHKLIIGDFNVALNADVDRYRTQRNNDQSKEVIKNVMEEYVLSDVWRDRNPGKIMLTWRKHNPRLVGSRLDYALISAGLDNWVENITYISAFQTDHLALFVSVNIGNRDRGPGYWKFNCALLNNSEFNTYMSDTLDQFEAQQGECPNNTWERLKKRIKDTAQSFARKNKSESKLIISQLLEKISEIETEYELPLSQSDEILLHNSKVELEVALKPRGDVTRNPKQGYQWPQNRTCECVRQKKKKKKKKKKKLEELVTQDIRGVIYRTKAKWYEMGEKNHDTMPVRAMYL